MLIKILGPHIKGVCWSFGHIPFLGITHSLKLAWFRAFSPFFGSASLQSMIHRHAKTTAKPGWVKRENVQDLGFGV